MKFNYFKHRQFDATGIIHVGACRADEIKDYTSLNVNKVIWIEPNPDVFSEMEVALANTATHVQSFLVKKAACDVDDREVDFYVCYGPDAGYMIGNKGCSSLLHPSDQMIGWHRDTIKVKTITLDTIFQKGNLNISDFQCLHMDVQGSELSVLKGASSILPSIKYISSEILWRNPEYVGNVTYLELIEYLENKGFRFVESNNLYSKDWGDALFVNEKYL